MKQRVHHIHLVGIGGVGMAGLAEILRASGYRVSGSDRRESAVLERLRPLGIVAHVGHAAEHIEGADVVVYSTAIPATNPELMAAERAQVPVIPRAEMLAELMRTRRGIAVAGSHGKTTTTSMIGALLQAAELDPTIVVGGRVHSLGSNAHLGSSDLMVAEADESDGSFLRLWPTIVVVTNIDREHLDYYKSLERLRDAFLDFVNRVPFWGACVLCLDDPQVQDLLPRLTRRARTYGLTPQAEIRAEDIEAHGLTMRFRVRVGEKELGQVQLGVPGRHNVQNALAAIAVALELDVPFEAMRSAFAVFRGVERRFERRGERGGVEVIEDYAHHPTEIRATLAAARQAYTGRIVVAFQPHRYTRTRDLFEDFARAFHDADVLLITEIYAAGEEKSPGIDAAALAEAARDCGHRHVSFVGELPDLIPALESLTRAGDVLFFMGAGDIGRQAAAFLEGGRSD